MNNAAQLTVTVSGSATDGVRSAGIPHSIVQAALQNDLPVKVVFTDVGARAHPAKRLFNEASLTDCDLGVEHARRPISYLAYQRGRATRPRGLRYTPAAFQKGQQRKGWRCGRTSATGTGRGALVQLELRPAGSAGAHTGYGCGPARERKAPTGDPIQQQRGSQKAQYLVFSHRPAAAGTSLTVHKSSFPRATRWTLFTRIGNGRAGNCVSKA